jgi:hypothetical protein
MSRPRESWLASSGRIARHGELLRKAIAASVGAAEAEGLDLDAEFVEYAAIRALEVFDRVRSEPAAAAATADDAVQVRELVDEIGEDVEVLLLETQEEKPGSAEDVCQRLVALLTADAKAEADGAADTVVVDDDEEDEDESSNEEGIGDEEEGSCRMCERETFLTRHHVVPRTTHKKMLRRGLYTKDQCNHVELLCRPCHSAIHRFEDEESLALNYSTLEKILAHPKVRCKLPHRYPLVAAGERLLLTPASRSFFVWSGWALDQIHLQAESSDSCW